MFLLSLKKLEKKPLLIKADPSLTFNGFLYLCSLKPNFKNLRREISLPTELKSSTGIN